MADEMHVSDLPMAAAYGVTSGCTEKCWTPVPCPVHGDRMNPLGRSAPLGAEGCCDRYTKPSINPRHLWHEHDSTRWYTDPEGWDEHERTCGQCRGDDDDA